MSPALVFLDAATVGSGDIGLEALRRLGDLTLHAVTSPAETASRIAGREVVITNKVRLDAELLQSAAGRLRMVAIAATGSDHVDLEAARRLGIAVANVTGYSTESVAQHTIGLLLNLATRQHVYAADPRAWCRSATFARLDQPVIELAGRTFGLAGAGAIGARAGEIAAALGMRVQCLERPGSGNAVHPEWPRLPLREFLASSDVVSLHCPLTPETRLLIRAETLAWMRPGSFLINTGRGALVDETALAAALRQGRLGGAGLDVLSVEPPPPDHPLLAPDIPNLVLTPHSAWTARETRQRLVEEIARNIAAFTLGERRNRLD